MMPALCAAATRGSPIAEANEEPQEASAEAAGQWSQSSDREASLAADDQSDADAPEAEQQARSVAARRREATPEAAGRQPQEALPYSPGQGVTVPIETIKPAAAAGTDAVSPVGAGEEAGSEGTPAREAQAVQPSSVSTRSTRRAAAAQLASPSKVGVAGSCP